jgi:hypothetical protein
VRRAFRAILNREPESDAVLNHWSHVFRQRKPWWFARVFASTKESFNFNKGLIHPITGYLDKYRMRKGKVVFKGWACRKHDWKPIDVEIYVGGKPVVGKDRGAERQLVSTVTANRSIYNTEAKCATGKNLHSFEVHLRVSSKYENTPVEVMGVDTVTGERFPLDQRWTHIPRSNDDDD